MYEDRTINSVFSITRKPHIQAIGHAHRLKPLSSIYSAYLNLSDFQQELWSLNLILHSIFVRGKLK